MKKVLLILVLGLLVVPVFAEETETTQLIDNNKSNVSINLNSQIKPDGEINKQEIGNKGSWFNININRNTYKLYCKEEADKE